MPRGLRRLRSLGAATGLTQALAGSFALKVFSAFFAFITSLVLARWLGSDGYGAYAVAIAWAMLLGIPAILGMDRLVVRSVAAHSARDEWGLVRGIVRRANQWVLLTSILLAAIGAMVGWMVLEGPVRQTFVVGMLLVPILSVARVRKATLQGLHRVVLGQVPELVVLHVILLGLVASAQQAARLSSLVAVEAHVAAALVSLLLGAWLLARNRPAELSAAAPEYQSRTWLKAALPLTVLSGIMVVNGRTDVVMVGWLAGVPEAGTYDVASKVSDIVAFLLTALNQASAPAFARLHALGKKLELQTLMGRQTRLILAGTAPLAAGLLIFGDRVMGIFGAEFVVARGAMSILVVGQLVNVAAGPVGLLLMMSGHERLVAVGFGLGAALNLVLNFLFIPLWGLTGAAVATATSMAIWNVILIVFMVRTLGIRPWGTGRGGQATQE